MYSISGKGLGKWKDSVFGTSDPMRGTIVFIMIGELCTSFSCQHGALVSMLTSLEFIL